MSIHSDIISALPHLKHLLITDIVVTLPCEYPKRQFDLRSLRAAGSGNGEHKRAIKPPEPEPMTLRTDETPSRLSRVR